MPDRETTRRDALKLLGIGATATALSSGAAAATPERTGHPVLEAKTLVGNDLTGEDGAIRGIDAGGVPWVIDRGRVKLHANGKLDVDVDGLVLDPEIVSSPPGGTNPIPQFRAIVSVLTPGNSDHAVENIRTETFAADSDGNARLSTRITLPETYLAPIVFVAGASEVLGADLWFAVTGF